MPVNKKDIDNLLAKFQDCSWVDDSEAAEIRQYLFELIDRDELTVFNFEACFDEDYAICSPSTLWKTLEDIGSNNNA